MRVRIAAFTAFAVVVMLLAACSASPSDDADVAADGSDETAGQPEGVEATGHGEQGDHGATTAPASAPLRKHERFVDLRMPEPYTPEAPTYGTDDYRCFLLDPSLAEKAYVTGVDVLPGRPELVHHVILFRVGPDQVAAAKAKDAAQSGEGWTCFGGTGLSSGIGDSLDAAPWLGAWAPGGGERLMAKDVGIPLQAGSQIIMQVHYNLLAGDGSDTSAARLRMAPGDGSLEPLETMLLPAPIELPCRPGHDEGDLCDRDKAVRDVMGRFGQAAGQTVAGLQLLCEGNWTHPRAGATQHCDRQVLEPSEIRAVAGHMHLLGRSITIELNPGRPDAQTLLDIEPWNFDEQGAIPLDEPVAIGPGDELRVTCRHSQRMRDLLPALADQPERYVVWGEGTTDEMCLGIVLLTRDR
jgi:hypothetical protein